MDSSERWNTGPNLIKLLRNRETKLENCRAVQRHCQFTESLIKRLGLQKELKGHQGCVNCLQWSSDGRRLASGSDDTNVLIWDPFHHRLLKTLRTPHVGNIFSVKFLGSDDSLVATAAGDCRVVVQSMEKEMHGLPLLLDCGCHIGRVKRLVTSPEQPQLFWSASEDGLVMQHDLRETHLCQGKANVLIDLNFVLELKCIALNPVNTNFLAVGGNDSYVRVYDRRMLKLNDFRPTNMLDPMNRVPAEPQDPRCVQYFAPGHLIKEEDEQDYKLAATYLAFNSSGTELLVNMGSEHIYLYDINNPRYHVKELGLPESYHRKRSSVYKNCCDLIASSPKAVSLKELYRYNQRIVGQACACDYIARGKSLLHRKWIGDIYAAARDFLYVVKSWPENTEAYIGLIQCLVALNWKQEANKWIQHFLKYNLEFTDNAQIKELLNQVAQLEEKTQPTKPSFHNIFGEQERDLRLGSRDYELRFLGHCNATTDIKEANYLGDDGNFICAGSDDGIIFIWDRKTTNVLTALWGDGSIVNCVQPHSTACLLATSGIDPFVKIWTPFGEEGIHNSRVVSDPWTAIETNQKRMRMDPLESMLADIEYRIGPLEPEDFPPCQAS